MKKLIYLTAIILFGIALNPAYAASATPAPTKSNDPVKEKLDSQINELKEKIASRVSELNLVEKRGVIGTVTEVKGNQLTLSDAAGNTRFVDVDEITKFTGAGQNSTFGLSDITKGSRISALGIYNKQSKRLLARFVKTYSEPVLHSGAITAIDPKNFQLTIMTPEQKEIKVDVEASTKLSAYTPEDGVAKHGFSKLAVGDRIALAATPGSDANVLEADRLVSFIGIPKDPRIQVAGATTASPSAAASTTPSTTTPTPTPRRNLSPIR
jgi:hypothetical protein